jgi:putative endonuclease
MFHVYVLKSTKTNRRYVGSCQDVDARLRRHNAGDTKSTRYGIPWRIVYREDFSTRLQSLQRERYFKTGRGRDELDAMCP